MSRRIGRVGLLIVGIIREARISAASIVAIVVLPVVAVSAVTISIAAIISPPCIIPIDRAVDGSGIVERLRPRRSKGPAGIIGTIVIASIYAGAVDSEITVIGAFARSMTFADGQRSYGGTRISSDFTGIRAAAIT